MERHWIAKQSDDDRLKNVWRGKATINDKYEEHRPELLKFLDEFEDMWDGRLRVYYNCETLCQTSWRHIPPSAQCTIQGQTNGNAIYSNGN